MLLQLAVAITLPFLLAALAVCLPARWGSRLALIGPAGVGLVGLSLWRSVPGEPHVLRAGAWVPPLGIEPTLLVDRLGIFFLLLIGLVGIAIVQYARAYFGPKASKGFWALLLLFMGAMTGLVVSDSLVLFYVFWELTTVTSALLIGGDGQLPEARRGAVQAFLVTGLGGLALLAGIVLIGQLAGGFEFSRLALRGDALRQDPRHLLPLGLMLTGALAKSAQLPFHFWLPGAMAAPTPVSAYLHSATMVQAGIVLLGRLFPAFGGSPLWAPVLATVGLGTFVVAGWSALRSWDLKRLLAYSTAAYLGLVTAYYGIAGRVGLRDELMLIANHALYKSALFLLVGWIEKVTGTRDLRTLAPERWVQHVPVGAALFGVGVMAMAGAPLLLGFTSKELFLQSLLAGGTGPARLAAVAATVFASGLSLAYALKFGVVFFGREPAPVERGHPRHEVSAWLWAIPALLLLPQVLGGVAPRTLGDALEPGTALESGPAFWHHADLLLVLSLAGYVVGVVLFAVWQPVARKTRTVPSGDTVAGALADGVLDGAARLSRAVQAGGHPRYLALVTVSAALAAVGLAMAQIRGRWPVLLAGPEAGLAWVPALLVLTGTLGVLRLSGRAAKAIALGLAGFGVALFYALFRAPDLVLTQIVVESLSFMLLLLAFGQLPPMEADSRPARVKAWHAAVGLAVGLGLAALALGAAARTAPDPSGAEQLARALPDGHGRNAVNVILVDIRGGDTLGEIAVLAIAALGALVLLGRPKPRPGPRGPRSRILEQASHGLLPAALVFAFFLLWRGHDRPGGGFIAGLVTSLALVLQAVAFGPRLLRRRLRSPVLAALAMGLALATAAASLALALGEPFFTHLWAPAALPAFLSTTFLFDLGVFAVVVATASVFVAVLEEAPR